MPAALHTGAPPLLQTIGLTKRYGTFLANENIDIDIWPQQIHALLGENGAGKSTLIKILGGIHRPDAGVIHVNGRAEVIHDVLAPKIDVIPRNERFRFFLPRIGYGQTSVPRIVTASRSTSRALVTSAILSVCNSDEAMKTR